MGIIVDDSWFSSRNIFSGRSLCAKADETPELEVNVFWGWEGGHNGKDKLFGLVER